MRALLRHASSSRAARAPRAALVACSCLLAGCGPQLGGQTGSEGTTDVAGACEPEATAIGSDARGALGFSADDVLAFAEGTHGAELAWEASGADVFGASLNFGPEDGVVALELEIRRRGGGARLVHFVPADAREAGGMLGIECPPDQIEVDVTVSLSTAGGALRETFDAVLVASEPALASFSKELPLAGLSGTFEAGLTGAELAPGELSVGPLRVDASVFPGGTRGGLGSSVTLSQASRNNSTTGGTTGQTSVVYGRWPAGDPCEGDLGQGLGGAPLSLDAALGSGAGALRAALAALAPRALTWAGGGETELSVELSPLGQLACAGAAPLVPGETPSLRAPVVVHVATADGLLDSVVPGVLEIPAGAAGTLTLTGSRACTSSGEFAAECGVHGVELASYSGVELELEATRAAGAGGFDGSLEVRAATAPICRPPPDGEDGVPACAGFSWSPIASGTFGDP